MRNSAVAFRGYNVTNLGRSSELLAHVTYGPVVERFLRAGSDACRTITGRKSNLLQRVRKNRETTLRSYSEAITLVVSMEMAQLELLRSCFGIDYHSARFSFGYSLGEISALVAGGVVELSDALRIPLSLAEDCVQLAQGVSLGVLFSRGEALPLDTVRRMCVEINTECRGVMGISAYLSPNSLLLMGQADTLERFQARMREMLPAKVYLRKSEGRWPPLHTPIMWDRCIPDRSAVMMHGLQGGLTAPHPPVLSLVTGKLSYNDYNAREILHRWIDHPQRLWDAVYETLALGIETIIHVGPQPNIIPATYTRLRDNVEAQTRGRIGMRALRTVVKRPWLKKLLPVRAALLRAPLIKHVVLEDWLLQQQPPKTS